MPLNVLITNSKSGAFYEIAVGWKNALSAGGHKAELWNGDERTWHNYRPDLFIGDSSWKQNFFRLRKKYNTKISIHVNPYCSEKIQARGGPLINEPKENIQWTVIQSPDMVFGYGLQEDMDKYWSFWRDKHGIALVGMPNAADSLKYKSADPDPAHKCDIGWVGGYWPYKAQNIDKYLIPVVRKFRAIWYGWSGPKDIWKGKATQQQITKLFNSAKICPSVVEPHTTIYGIDIPERMFKIAACGALVILDPTHGIGRYFSLESVVLASNPKEYHQLCEKYIKMDEIERTKQARKMQREVLQKHTYLNRIQTLLNSLGFNKEAQAYDALIKSQVPG